MLYVPNHNTKLTLFFCMYEKKNQFHALASRLVKIFCLRLFTFGIMNPIKWELNRNFIENKVRQFTTHSKSDPA